MAMNRDTDRGSDSSMNRDRNESSQGSLERDRGSSVGTGSSSNVGGRGSSTGDMDRESFNRDRSTTGSRGSDISE
jgi:hypothetical protein